MDTLTKRQADILEYIRTFAAANGFSPSMQEIADGCGFKSKNTVRYHLRALRDGGRLRWNDRMIRSYVVVEPESVAT